MKSSGQGAAPSRTQRGPHLAHVQGLRGIAVLGVVAYHAGLPIPGGFTGVDVFFVISGFVITLALGRDVDSTGGIRLVRFYGRRVRRLLPALALMLVVTMIASALVQSPFGAQRDTAIVALGAITWSANVVLYLVTGDYFANDAETIPLLHTWSLSVEEQFYLGLPFVIAAVAWWARLKGLRWRPLLAWLLILGLLASFALSLLLSYGHPLPAVSQPESAAFYSAPTRAWQFIAGVLLALVAASRNGLPAAVRHSATGVIGAALVGLGYAIVHADHAFPGIGAAIPTLGATAVIAGGHRLPGFSSRLLTWIGDLSYSWYLWHWPFIVISKLVAPGKFTAVIAAALSLGIAWIAYHTVEEPIRRRPVDQRRQLARLVLACALPPLLAAVSRASRNCPVAVMRPAR